MSFYAVNNCPSRTVDPAFKTTHSANKYGLKLKVVLKCRDIYIENASQNCVSDGMS